MSHYKKEITKWLYILMDKFFLDGAFVGKHSDLNAQESYGLIRFEDGMNLTEFSTYYNENRKKSQAYLNKLIRLGYLEKRDDPEDNRKKLLYLTFNGVEKQNRLALLFSSQLESILNELTYNDSVGVLKFISKVNQLTVDKADLEALDMKKRQE